MKKNKFNPELLKEEINRYKLLETYDFYHDDKSGPEFKLEEEDEEPQVDGEVDANAEMDAQAPEQSPESGDAGMDNAQADIANELGVADDTSGDAPIGDMPEPAPSAEEVPIEEPVDDGIEIDVTALVKGSEEAKASADRAVQTSELVLQQLAAFDKKLAGMTILNDKLNNIEQQIVKRIPTPVEKLEMRSFDSYPYNQKLTDYWSEKEGPYEQEEAKEYVLTKDDVDSEYSESEIQDSFSDYEEEDIY
jgi:hypothetical protein